MLAEMENEAQLAAVLGHEIAHVNCGHTASAMSKSTVYDMLITGTQGYLASQGSSWADLAGTAGQLGSAVVLASYSRAQEREADEGGMLYMVRAGYDPQGMVQLQQLLVRLSGANPSALEQMFSTHPMSTERLQTAQERARTQYAGQNSGVLNREAYLAATASIRKNKEAFKSFAAAEAQLARKQYAAAKASAEQGLRLAPNDYVGLMLVARAHQGPATPLPRSRSLRRPRVSIPPGRVRRACSPSARFSAKTTPEHCSTSTPSSVRCRVKPLPPFTRDWPMTHKDSTRRLSRPILPLCAAAAPVRIKAATPRSACSSCSPPRRRSVANRACRICGSGAGGRRVRCRLHGRNARCSACCGRAGR